MAVTPQDIALATLQVAGGQRTVTWEDEDGQEHSRLETHAEWLDRVMLTSTEITVALDEKSALIKHITEMQNCTVFVATVTGGGIQQNTGRGEVKMVANGRDEEETIVTEFLNTGRGKATFELAKQAKRAAMDAEEGGGKVLIYKYMEEGEGKAKGKKFRTLKHIAPLN